MNKRRNSLVVKTGIAVIVIEALILTGVGLAYLAWLFPQQGLGGVWEALAWGAPPASRAALLAGAVAGFLAILLTSLATIYLLNTQIFARLRILGDVVRQMQPESAAAPSPGMQDEIGCLHQRLSAIRLRMSERGERRELPAVERARDLEPEAQPARTALAVGRALAGMRDFDTLLTEAPHLIADHFGFYHVGIFLLDEAGEYAALRAANSAGGQQLVARRHRLPLNQESLIGRVVATHEPHSSQTGDAAGGYFPDPDLPEAHSELALPLCRGAQLWGVLDIRSVQEAAFTPVDIEALRGLADWLAAALDNARLITEAQDALAAQRRAYGEVTRQAWEELLRSQSRGYVSVADGLSPSPAHWSAGMLRAKQEGQIVQEDAATLAVPVKSRDEQVLGVVRFRRAAETGAWNAQQVALVETLSDRLSQALESARLYEESRRLALQERLVGAVSSRIRESLEMESVLQVAARELAEAFGLEDVVIRLGAADELLAQARQPAQGESEA